VEKHLILAKLFLLNSDLCQLVFSSPLEA